MALNGCGAKLRRVAAPLAFLLLAGFAVPAAASGAIPLPPCAKSKPVQCGTVTVPLDRSGAVKGSVNLAVRRIPALQGPAQGTLVFVAGGPGESAVAAFPGVGGAFRRALPNFDIVTFDQRGTGRSGLLRCRARTENGLLKCARRLGAKRSLYRTTDSVDDLEAVRQAVGAPVISLFAVSYGGRVAGEYARRYPAAVSRMVLDSPVPLFGLESLDLQRLGSLPRVLGSVCSNGACSAFTKSPYGDLTRVAARARRRPLKVTIVTPRGRKVRTRLGVADLLGLVSQSDTASALRFQLPAVLRSARAGDTAPLARLAVRATSVASANGAQGARVLNPFLNRVTHCSEANFPWSPASKPGRGRGQALKARIDTLGAPRFAPFGVGPVVVSSLVGRCLAYPAVATPGPLAGGPGPAAPTLVINGEEDLRTPVEDGRAVTAGYPAAGQLVVPYVGHSVLVNDESGCARGAVFSFLGGGVPPPACPAKPRPGPVAFPLPARLKALPGKSRRAKTMAAAALTIDDLLSQFDLAGSAKRFGGLRGGRVELGRSSARILGYQVFSGVRLSGRLNAGGRGFTARLRISGGGTLPASVRVLRGGRLRLRFSGANGASAALSSRLPRSEIPRTPRVALPTP